ncbi:uncharacterized protein cubi_02384 [Cryptosporidium ubiquitum]|uniref:Uncharacterized protein n=1 Tax=Cryptosporidium ubiquitum TaxID=857276 RepID=A0A1J4MG04_9CRYT|nr:uncharacterized protein cubi_02384 [Cryptosporidium ubiquitum]OII73152.1 hypothetical protein cubi_02384 [Cryptosporidium ubiquitum]
MYSQIPISPTLRTKYNSGNQEGQRKINNVSDMNISTSPYSNNMATTNLDGYGAFDNINRDSEFNKPNIQKSSFMNGSFRPSSSNTNMNNGINVDIDANKPDMGRFLGNLSASTTVNQNQTNSTSINTPVSAFPPPSIPFQNSSSKSGGFRYHSPKNARPTQPLNNLQSVSHISKPFIQNSNKNSNFQNIPIPPPPKVPFSDCANTDDDSSFNRKMQDNKERLEQLNISRTMLTSMGSPSNDYHHSNSQNKSQEIRTHNQFQGGRNSVSHIGIQEPNSNKNISRPNPKLPPKVPGISSNNKFKLNISQPAQNSQISLDVPEIPMKNMDSNAERNMVGLKDIARPPTAPTFFPSNKSNLDNVATNSNNSSKFPSQAQNAIPVIQSSFFSSDLQVDSRISLTPNQIQSAVRPPTAPNSISKSSSLPKVDLLMNLMDKTVENKRKEFEKLNKLKSALSELGDFNKKLLEENTRLKSGNNSSNLQEISLLSRDLPNNSVEFTNSYQTPMSDTINSFIPDTQDPETQINSLKTIINKKNQRILELERKISNVGSKEDISAKECDITYSLLQRLKDRDECINSTLEEIQGSCFSSIIDRVDNCISILTEKNYGKLKTMANDVLNQIEFNYKALSVTLEHLFEQQSSTLENIKHDGKVDTQLESSNLHSKLNSKEYNTQEIDLSPKVNTISNSPKKNFDNTFIQENNQSILNSREKQGFKSYSNSGDEFPPQKTVENNMEKMKFSDENRNIEQNKEISIPQCIKNSSTEVNYNYKVIPNQHQEPNLYQNSIFNQETQDQNSEFVQNQNLNIVSGVPQDILINNHTTGHFYELNKGEGHSSSAHRVEQEDSCHPTFNTQHQGLHNDCFGQYEGDNIDLENENAQEEGIDYVEGIPPPIFAAYNEGIGSENNDIFSMNPILSADGVNFENYSHYQVPANYSNI